MGVAQTHIFNFLMWEEQRGEGEREEWIEQEERKRDYVVALVFLNKLKCERILWDRHCAYYLLFTQ
jgi:hypothetical protein